MALARTNSLHQLINQRQGSDVAMLPVRCVTDHDMIICDLDESFAEIMQQSSLSLRGKSIYDLTYPDDIPVNRRLLDGLRNEGKPFSITKRYLRDNGDIIWVRNEVSLFSRRGDKQHLQATIHAIEAPRPQVASNLTLTAESILKLRLARLAIFDDDLFGEPSYEVLLDLFVNEQRGRSVSVSSACVAASVPSTTALRHIARLVSSGWIERVADVHDKRRTNLALTARGFIRVSRYLEECDRARRSF